MYFYLPLTDTRIFHWNFVTLSGSFNFFLEYVWKFYSIKMNSVGLPSTNMCQVYFNLWLQLTIFSTQKLVFFLRVDFDSCIQRPCVTPCDTIHSIHDTAFYLKIMRLLSSWGWKKARVNPSHKKSQKIQWTDRLKIQQQLNHLQDDFAETESLVWYKSIKVLEYW